MDATIQNEYCEQIYIYDDKKYLDFKKIRKTVNDNTLQNRFVGSKE